MNSTATLLKLRNRLLTSFVRRSIRSRHCASRHRVGRSELRLQIKKRSALTLPMEHTPSEERLLHNSTLEADDVSGSDDPG